MQGLSQHVTSCCAPTETYCLRLLIVIENCIFGDVPHRQIDAYVALQYRNAGAPLTSGCARDCLLSRDEGPFKGEEHTGDVVASGVEFVDEGGKYTARVKEGLSLVPDDMLSGP